MPAKKTTHISIIIPVYNEEDMIHDCHAAVKDIISSIKNIEFSFVFVNDGSTDGTADILNDLKQKNKHVRVITLSRNFGKEAAVTAGLDNIDSDAAVILDADLQDPPSLIPDMIKTWQDEKADVVYGQRLSRAGETFFKKFSSASFYKVMDSLSGRVSMPANCGDFRLLNRRSIEAVRQLRESHRYMKGLFCWIGYKQVALPYHREPRLKGRSKWDYIALWNLSFEGITSFSIIPLRMATLLGFFISLFAILFGSYIIFKTLMFGSDVPGYPSLMAMVTFLSGIQLVCIGLLGEYIGRIFNETKKRPLYFIQDIDD